VEPSTALFTALDAALPQTQCTRCGYPDCSAYAKAMAVGKAGVNQCPPGGSQGIATLARLTGQPLQPLDPARGAEGPRQLAVIDEAWCIGCTLCLQACPVDCIVGGPKHMHTVIDHLCTGCELCLPACPVDCISLTAASGQRSGWDAWSPAQADEARARYGLHRQRLERERQAHDARPQPAGAPGAETEPAVGRSRNDVIAAALARARSIRGA
jgi:electron transport complex protein RnfB